MKEPGKTYAATVLVALFILSAPQSLVAQKVQPYPPPRSQTSKQAIGPTMEADSRTQGSSDSAADNKRREKSADAEAILLRRQQAAQLAEDLDRLRRINREKMTPISSAASPDYKQISEIVREINARAKRIKDNSPLVLKDKKGEKSAYYADDSRLDSMLPELSRLIDSFIGNPVFHVASVNDEELRSTAGHDLAGIIRLSETINKIAKRLARTSS